MQELSVDPHYYTKSYDAYRLWIKVCLFTQYDMGGTRTPRGATAWIFGDTRSLSALGVALLATEAHLGGTCVLRDVSKPHLLILQRVGSKSLGFVW